MIGRIVEIGGDGRYLSADRGFMQVSHGGKILGTVPLDDIAALICNAHGLVYSNALLLALAERGCPVVLCGRNHAPAGVVWGVDTHHLQSGRLDLQIRQTVPRRKQLWRQVVQSKLSMQALALRLCGKPPAPLSALVRKVRSGDVGNVEGQGARAYWGLLFGKDFRRDRDGEGLNSLLNYGYAVLRSVVARRVMACGLHPGIGIYHANAGNPMRLVDDLMEPFRPVVDAWVWRLHEQGIREVDSAAKAALGRLPVRNLVTVQGVSPLTVVVERLCQSFVGAMDAGALDLPHLRKDAMDAIWDEEDAREESPQTPAP